MSSRVTTAPAALTMRPAGFAERLILAAFAAMPAGRMQLDLPDGTSRVFGDRGLASAALAPGITNHAHLRIKRPAFFKKCLLRGDIGFAESFMDGDWETPDLTAVVGWFVINHRHAPTLSGSSRARSVALNLLRAVDRLGHLLRPNSRHSAHRNIAEHYDLSNDF